jgi:phage gp29-like protein
MADTPARRGPFASLVALTAGILERAAGALTGPPTVVEKPRPLTQQLLYVGVQTPDDVAALMRLADTGYMYRLCDFWEEQRNRDCHLNTVAYRREHALSTVGWQMVPASDRPRDLRIAAWTEDALKRMGDVEHREARAQGLDLRPFADLVVHLNGATIPGYAASELLYTKDSRRIIPAGALPMGSRRFVYSQFDGSLRWWDATGPVDGVPYPGRDLLRDFPSGRFIVHRPRINGAAGPREGLIRPLLWASLFRTWDIGDWLKLAELAWKPYRWGTYKPEAGDADIKALDKALQLLMSHGWTRISERTALNIKFPENTASAGGGQHEALARFLAEEMSKAATGHTLTVEEGKKGTARTAATGEHVAHGILEIDARAEEGTIQRHLIAPLVRANFGNVPCPRFVFVTELGADITALSTAIATLVEKAGLKGITAAWVRSLLGAPEPDEGQEVLGGVLWTPPTKTAEEMAAEKPVAPPAPEPAANDNDPDVTEKAMRNALRNYDLDRVLVAAGLRKAA